jgi:poly(3-hydroxybutyrate) depolymerase
MQSRLLRTALLAGLLACFNVACKEDPNTHSTFTAVTSMMPTSDASMPPPPMDADLQHADGNTSGCGMDPNQASGTYTPTPYHLSVAGPDLDASGQPKVRDRVYYVRLPTNYDQTMPNRVVYLGPGCGGNTYTEVFSLYKASGDNAILVAMMPVGPTTEFPMGEFLGCFDERMNSVEIPFFDALHKKIESQFCVDPARQFYAGFSTGARLGFMLDCSFSDVLRGTATDQGALPPLPTCKKNPIAGFFLADTMETGNPYQSNVMAANRLAMQNGCTGTFQNATAFDPMTMAPAYPTTACVKFTGCPADYPIVFCTTMGQGHMMFENGYWSDQAFWNFFKQF